MSNSCWKRGDHNLILSQRRADLLRDVLINTFKVAPKRLQALGLGEEQLQDTNRPAAPANARVQIIAIGKFETEPAKPATPAAPAQKGAWRRKRKADHPGRISAEGPQPDFATLDRFGTKVAAVNDTTTMRAPSARHSGAMRSIEPGIHWASAKV